MILPRVVAQTPQVLWSLLLRQAREEAVAQTARIKQ
jgi:hypothetical protein